MENKFRVNLEKFKTNCFIIWLCVKNFEGGGKDYVRCK